MPVGTQQFNYVVDDAFFQQREEGEIRGGNVDVKLEVEHKGDFFRPYILDGRKNNHSVRPLS